MFHEIVSDTVHVDVHPVDPKPGFPFYRLVTSGMSDLPMIVPEGTGAPRYGELVMTLPESWKMTTEAFQDENWYWPVLLIKTLATLPHKYSTRLGLGHTVPNGDPPRPHAPTTELCCAMLVLPFSVSAQFQTLKISNEKEICFSAVMVLYQDDIKNESGFGHFAQKIQPSEYVRYG